MTIISSDAISWIMLVSGAVACVSAIFSWRSSQVAANASQAALYLKFQEKYARDEMLEDLRRLRAWRDDQGEDFAKKWVEQWDTNPETREMDKSRRRVSHFFGSLVDLYRNHLLSKRLARLLASFSSVDLLFEVVEPLEKQLNADYDKSQFDILYSLTGSPVVRSWDRPAGSGARVEPVGDLKVLANFCVSARARAASLTCP